VYKPSTYLVITFFLPIYLYMKPSWYLFSYLSTYIWDVFAIYFPTYLPISETYFLQNWLPRWNHILTQLRFIHNWVISGIQWMVRAGSLLPAWSWLRNWLDYQTCFSCRPVPLQLFKNQTHQTQTDQSISWFVPNVCRSIVIFAQSVNDYPVHSLPATVDERPTSTTTTW
jgi:hypothetical protein